MIIKGNEVQSCNTMKSMYDHNCIQVTIHGKNYKIGCEELVKLFAPFSFQTETKRIHTYLHVIGGEQNAKI